VVQPADLGLGAEDHRLQDEQPGEVALVAVDLEPRVLLERAQRRGALALDHVGDVDARRGDGERELDGEFVARAVGGADGRGEPAGEVAAARVRDRVRTLTGLVLGERLDQAVAFQARQRRIDLADVERPGGTGRVLERGAQLVAVGRAVLEQREQTVFDAHDETPES
jgi:hypothetical protein